MQFLSPSSTHWCAVAAFILGLCSLLSTPEVLAQESPTYTLVTNTNVSHYLTLGNYGHTSWFFADAGEMGVYTREECERSCSTKAECRAYAMNPCDPNGDRGYGCRHFSIMPCHHTAFMSDGVEPGWTYWVKDQQEVPSFGADEEFEVFDNAEFVMNEEFIQSVEVHFRTIWASDSPIDGNRFATSVDACMKLCVDSQETFGFECKSFNFSLDIAAHVSFIRSKCVVFGASIYDSVGRIRGARPYMSHQTGAFQLTGVRKQYVVALDTCPTTNMAIQ